MGAIHKMPDLNLFDLIARHSNPTRYENFLSVSLAWCLENDEEFRKQFFQKILFPNDSKGDDWNGWEIEVQKSISVGTRTKYPDLVFSKSAKCIVIEVKNDAGISYSLTAEDEESSYQDKSEKPKSELQLYSYRKWLDNKKGVESELFLLAKHYMDESDEKIQNSKTKIIYWNDLRKIDKNSLAQIGKQFIFYLEKEGIIMEKIPFNFKEKLAEYIKMKETLKALGETLRDYLDYSYKRLKSEYKFKENAGSQGGNITSGWFYYYPFEIERNNIKLEIVYIGFYTDPENPEKGIRPTIGLSYNKIPDSVLSYLKSKYKEEDDYHINNKKGELEVYNKFVLKEEEETFERQRERFAQTFLDRVEELLTLGKSLGENRV